MIKDNNIAKKILAIIFVMLLFVGFVRNGSYARLNDISKCLSPDQYEEEDRITFDELEKEYASSVWNRKELLDLNGFFASRLNMRGLYSDMGMYITDDKCIVSASEYTSTDYETEQILDFKKFLDANGISLVYVNEPTKYVDDSLFRDEFGIESYSNRNMDLFLSRIRNEGIITIDLRDNLKNDGLNVSDLFYRTDHHWTVPAGLWASRIIAECLNENCGYNIDMSLYDIENYEINEWKECWLGEQGRKVGETYVGLDDFVELKPKFETSFRFTLKENVWDDSFDGFINESVYDVKNDVYKNPSWHYSYYAPDAINHNVDEGKILLLGDSYDHVTMPFLSLDVNEVTLMKLRNFDDSFDLRKYILENGYDTVVIAYAQFMLGAHDDESSANYRMYTFE